jgi:NADPH:quinone reductase-like Zn-dependent oxidoreductase
MQIDHFSGAKVLNLVDVPKPLPGAGEVLIGIHVSRS